MSIAGCADMDTVNDASLQSGISSGYNASYDKVTAATLTALSTLNVNITKSREDSSGTIYLVSKSLSWTSWGEVGRVFVQKSPAPPTLVFVYWEKRDKLQMMGTDADEFSQTLFNAISKIVYGR